ncbi:MAG: hypothetical protein PHV55_04775, partial [Candidatus Omnitrophica bacterium]|nr:hypothetical protein [Candidatus Omnitrophota bacterium]
MKSVTEVFIGDTLNKNMYQKYPFVTYLKSSIKNFLKKHNLFIRDLPSFDGREMSYRAKAFFSKKKYLE